MLQPFPSGSRIQPLLHPSQVELIARIGFLQRVKSPYDADAGAIPVGKICHNDCSDIKAFPWE